VFNIADSLLVVGRAAVLPNLAVARARGEVSGARPPGKRLISSDSATISHGPWTISPPVAIGRRDFDLEKGGGDLTDSLRAVSVD